MAALQLRVMGGVDVGYSNKAGWSRQCPQGVLRCDTRERGRLRVDVCCVNSHIHDTYVNMSESFANAVITFKF